MKNKKIKMYFLALVIGSICTYGNITGVNNTSWIFTPFLNTLETVFQSAVTGIKDAIQNIYLKAKQNPIPTTIIGGTFTIAGLWTLWSKYLGRVEDHKDIAYLNNHKNHEFNKTETKKTELLDTKVAEASKKMFSTHCLVIIADNTEYGADGSFQLTTLPGLFKEAALPILISASILKVYIEKTQELPNTFYYFHLTKPTDEEILNGKKTQFILCIPKKKFPKEAQKKVNTTTSRESEYELKLGIRVQSLEKLKNHAELNTECRFLPEVPLEDLKAAFIPKKTYDELGRQNPLWTIFIMGHGDQYKGYCDFSIRIAGLAEMNLIEILAFFATTKILAYTHITTCYGGGLNAAILLQKLQEKIKKEEDFILTTSSIHGDGKTMTGKIGIGSYQKAWDIIKKIPVPKNKKCYRCVYSNLLSALAMILPDEHDDLNNIPPFIREPKNLSRYLSSPNIPKLSHFSSDILAVKPLGKKYFVELAKYAKNNTSLAFITRIDSKILKNSPQKILSFPKDKSLILLYTNYIQKTIRLETNQLFVSAIPGDTFHHIKELVLEKNESSFEKNYSSICSLVAKFLPDWIDASKVFVIDQVANISPNGTCNPLKNACVRIDYDTWKSQGIQHFDIKILVSDTLNNIHYHYSYKSDWTVKYYSPADFFENQKAALTQIESKEALKIISSFDKKILRLKKAAFYLQKYRLLKNADIATEKQ